MLFFSSSLQAMILLDYHRNNHEDDDDALDCTLDAKVNYDPITRSRQALSCAQPAGCNRSALAINFARPTQRTMGNSITNLPIRMKEYALIMCRLRLISSIIDEPAAIVVALGHTRLVIVHARSRVDRQRPLFSARKLIIAINAAIFHVHHAHDKSAD